MKTRSSCWYAVFVSLALSACATNPPATVPAPVATKVVPESAPGEIMSLIQTGDCQQLAQRLDEGVPMPDSDAFGYTPLGLAAAHLNAPCMQALLDRGADVNAPMAGGWTPIILVAMGGGAEPLMAMLQARGADMNAQNRWGCTALYYATGFGALNTVDYLLTHGAAYPGTGGDCPTPLRIAQLRGYPALVQRFQKLDAPSPVSVQ